MRHFKVKAMVQSLDIAAIAGQKAEPSDATVKNVGKEERKKRINKYVHNSQYVCVSVCVCVCILWQMCATFTAVGRSRRRGIALSLALSPKGRIERRVVCVILSQSSCQL